jgi:hypothetical protein
MSASVPRLPVFESTTELPRSSQPKRELALAAHVLREMAQAQVDGRALDLDGLVRALGIDSDEAPLQDGVRARRIRREDVRAIVSQLDREGFVDAARMRLTLAGFAMGSSLAPRKVMPLRLV